MTKKSIPLDLVLGAIIIIIFIGFSFAELSIFEGTERVILDTQFSFSRAEIRSAKPPIEPKAFPHSGFA